jgi:hypothetical protein
MLASKTQQMSWTWQREVYFCRCRRSLLLLLLLLLLVSAGPVLLLPCSLEPVLAAAGPCSCSAGLLLVSPWRLSVSSMLRPGP